MIIGSIETVPPIKALLLFRASFVLLRILSHWYFGLTKYVHYLGKCFHHTSFFKISVSCLYPL